MRVGAVLGVAGWISCGVLAAGMLNAEEHAGFGALNSCREAQEQLGFAVVLGILGGPAALIAFTFVTGFGASGWTLSRGVCR